MSEAFATRTLADIAAAVPGATGVFRRAKLDFCCGGQVPLGEAAAAKGLSLAALEQELGAVAARGLPASLPADTDAMIGVIETRFHAVHRQELPELVKLAKRVEAVHAQHPAMPRGIAALLQGLADELEAHMQKEEQILFPMMRRGGHPMIRQPIAVMLAEHDNAGEQLHRLEELTGHFATPEGACPTWQALYAGAGKFADDLMEHIHTENNVLFPRFV